MTTLLWEAEGATGADLPREEPRLGPDQADPWAAPTAVTYTGAASRPRRKATRRSRRAVPAEAVPRPTAGSRNRASTRRRAPRRAIRVLLAVPAALGLALLLAISLPVLFGCRSLVVMSGSMEPAISTGSVVVVKRIPAAEIAVGDVVSFHSPESARVLTHRVQAVAVAEGTIEVETRGDANTGSESWAIEPTGTVGRLVFEIPYLGYLLGPLQGAAARLLLVVGPALALGGILLASIWRDPAEPGRRAPERRWRGRRALRPARSEGA